jgi:vitamin B12 transporter
MSKRSFLLAAPLPLFFTAPATAQTPTPLPGIVVEAPVIQGATLEKPRVAAAPAVSAAAPAPAKKKSEAIAAPASAPAPAQAGNQPADVSASPTGNLRAGVPANTIGSSVSVVTASDLAAGQVRHMSDALRSLPGVSVTQTGSAAGLTEVRLRGAESNHTLVIIDGIQANETANGQFDFSSLSPEDIERIEVIRGPMSGLYGTGAIGGVVNIVTKRPDKPLSLSLRTEIGRFGTRDVAARIAGGNESAYIALSGQIRETSGFNISPVGPDPFSPFSADRDGARLGSFALSAGARVGANGLLEIVLRNVEKSGHRDGDDFGTFGTYSVAVDNPSTFTQSIWLAGVSFKLDTLDGKLTHEFKLNQNSTRTTDLDDSGFGPSLFINESRRDTASYGATYRFGAPGALGRHSVTGQVQLEDERFAPLSAFDDKIERQRKRLSFTGEWRGTFSEQLDLTGGVRHDDNDKFEDFTTWRASASWRIPGTGFRPHASIGTAVKMPDMFQQFGRSGFFMGNPNLKPEESRGYDAGLEYTFLAGNAVLDVTYFNNVLTDKIGGSLFSPVNVAGDAKREGVETSLRLRLTKQLSAGVAYTYTDARDSDGTREVRRPPHSGKADVRYLFGDGKGTVSVGAVYNGRRLDNYLNTTTFGFDKLPLDGYWLLTGAASYKVMPNVELYGRVENALNAKYQEIYGYNTAGIAAYAGVKLTFDDLAGVKK